ncbi:MAG: hypothetical protein WBG66_07095, partial [Geitlerinemataceae cyanobacterium]
ASCKCFARWRCLTHLVVAIASVQGVWSRWAKHLHKLCGCVYEIAEANASPLREFFRTCYARQLYKSRRKSIAKILRIANSRSIFQWSSS